MNKVSKNAMYYIFSNYFSAGLGFITSIFIIRYLDLDVFGAFSHIRNVTIFLLPFAWLGINSIFFRVLAYRTKYILFSFIFGFYVFISLLLSLLAIFIPTIYFGHTILDHYAINTLILFIFIFLSLIQNFFDTFLLVSENASWVSLMTFSSAIGGLAATLVLIVYKNINFSIIILICFYLLNSIVLSIAFRSKLAYSFKQTMSDFMKKDLLRDAWIDFKKEFKFFRFYSISTIVDIVLSRIANIYFANSGNTSVLGILSIYNQFVQVLLSLGWSINNSWGINRLRALIDKLKQGFEFGKAIGSFYQEVLVINFLMISIFLLTSPLWVSILGYMLNRWHLSYTMSFTIVLFICGRYVTEFLSRIFLYNCLYLKERLGEQMIIATIISGLLIPVNYILVKDYGFTGALIASVIPGIVTYLTSEIYIKTHRKFRLKHMMISFFFFAPISATLIPGRIYQSAWLALACSLVLVTAMYVIYGKRFKKQILLIINSFSILSKSLNYLVRYKNFIWAERVNN